MDAETSYLLLLGKAEDLRHDARLIEAESALKSAIQLEANRYEAYNDLGNLLLSRGETNAALTNFDKALLYCGKSPTNLLSLQAQKNERALIEGKIQKLRDN